MMKPTLMSPPLLLLLAGMVLLAGCASPDPRFYVLTAVPQTRPPLTDRGPELAVGVGPVEFPDYLDRPQIVTRTGQNELQIADFDRWAEPLKHNATQVLVENLAVLLPSKKVVAYPWRRATPVDYQVVIKVIRFDRSEGGDGILITRWTIVSGDGRNELLSRDSRYAERPGDGGYAATVAAMNRTLSTFSRDIAQALRTLQP